MGHSPKLPQTLIILRVTNKIVPRTVYGMGKIDKGGMFSCRNVSYFVGVFVLLPDGLLSVIKKLKDNTEK